MASRCSSFVVPWISVLPPSAYVCARCATPNAFLWLRGGLHPWALRLPWVRGRAQRVDRRWSL